MIERKKEREGGKEEERVWRVSSVEILKGIKTLSLSDLKKKSLEKHKCKKQKIKRKYLEQTEKKGHIIYRETI